jgi:dolichyl-diphosphooligosaccharide--protein glycosyltransferase
MATIVKEVLFGAARLAAFVYICYIAYDIRLHAVRDYGKVIHEFDPYFNFRSTEYLVDNGWNKFINWFDERSWYPLGRPVGTTIYPGLQLTAWGIFNALIKLGHPMSINDVCVMMPAWFSSVTMVFIFGIAYEVTRSANCGLCAAFVMSIVPAHIMRSVAGGFDNESIAVAAMCMTFYFWIRSLRSKSSWPISFLTAAAYTYMAAAWGGYVFVLNMIAVHALLLLLLGYYSSQLHIGYTVFYVFGTLGAIQFPVVGWAPLKSLEQLGAMGVFGLMQLAALFAYRKRTVKESTMSFRAFQFKILAAAGIVAAVGIAVLAPTGYFGPLSSRVRGLFVKHTHTGNPLVDSVAEHQATQDSAYVQFFSTIVQIAPLGFISLFWKRSEAKYFLFAYSLIALYFSRKMNRLVLLLGPAGSVLGGIAICGLTEWSLSQFAALLSLTSEKVEETEADDKKGEKAEKTAETPSGKDKKAKGKKTTSSENVKEISLADESSLMAHLANFKPFQDMKSTATKYYNNMKIIRVLVACGVMYFLGTRLRTFWHHSHEMARALSNPSIMMLANTRDGRTVMLDDFREAYWWLRDHTPQDSRVLSWWDYGYQIAQIANRTTLADGNTWNHEHIALLGKILVSPVKESHKIVRHLADYVLVWSTRFVGNPGDDIAKSPHMARIGGSVFKDINPNEFYVDRQGKPSPMMYQSLVYNLVLNKFDPSVPALPEGTYEEAYTSSNRMVRIYKVKNVSKKSKEYCAENRGYQAFLAGLFFPCSFCDPSFIFARVVL